MLFICVAIFLFKVLLNKGIKYRRQGWKRNVSPVCSSPFNCREIPGSMTKWRQSKSLWSQFRAVCCQTICVLYLQIGVLRTALHWINIQLIPGYTLILQQCLIHTGVLSGEKLSTSRAPAEALRTEQDTGPTWWCFVHQWPGFSLFSVISLLNNWLFDMEHTGIISV